MLCPHQCRLIEGLCELHQISSIFGACRLIRGMHRKLSHSDTPAFSQIIFVTASETASVVYFWFALCLMTTPPFM